ncbi:MAG TPA: AraC family transcriptional regulator [Caulobacteraceae bacterium]|nr:AraC family transcriptional regulator [Caulobacteraceae bacterium]
MAEPLIRSASLTGFAELARALGLDPYRLAAEQHVPARALADPDLLLPAAAVGRLLETASRRAGAPDFGLRLAETRNLSNLGAAGLLAREQPTLKRAIEVLAGRMGSHNQALALTVETEGDVAILREALTGPGAIAARQAHELVLGVLVRTIRRLMGQTWRPEAVFFVHAAPADLATHRRVLGVTPRFDEAFNGLAFDARELERLVPGSDPVAAERLERYVAEVEGAGRAGAAAEVEALIQALLPQGACSIARVVQLMGTNRRTLHRRLAEEGTSFTALVERARLELCRADLASGRRSMTEIAERLGYGSLSAFSRWKRTRFPA